jgi:predicted PurR-regulated permease PerM
MPIELTDRQRRLVDTILVLAAVALGFVVAGFLATVFYAFGDILLLFFLAWLLTFSLVPLINRLTRLVPGLPDVIAVIAVYAAIVLVFLAVIIQASASLATSIGQLIRDAPQLESELRNVLAGLETRLTELGFQVDLVGQAPEIVQNLQAWAGELVGPLQSLAFASIGVLGNVLILVMLSVYIAVDRTAVAAFLYRLVPPGYVAEARLLQVSVSRSFGGFLRGQAIMGLAFGVIAAVANVAFGLEYAAITTVTAGLLHAIPFFGPFVSWAPPVAVALLLSPDVLLPVVAVMGIGWFLTMNVLQPRLMAGAVGIHPTVVLASVIIGAKVAGIAGAIFGIPIAAVLSAFFFHWVGRSREAGTVADRAAQRLSAREGREVRRPREPVPGVDEDLAEVGSGSAEHDPERPAVTATGAPGAGPAPLTAGEAER